MRSRRLEADLEAYSPPAERALVVIYFARSALTVEVDGVAAAAGLVMPAVLIEGERQPKRPGEREGPLWDAGDRGDAVRDESNRRLVRQRQREVGVAGERPGHDHELGRVHRVVALDHDRERPAEGALARRQAEVVPAGGVRRAVRAVGAERQHG